VFSGFVAEVNAPDMPAGSAVLATDCDYTVTSVRTRDGIENVYTYCNLASDSDTETVQVAGTGTSWTTSATPTWNNTADSSNCFAGSPTTFKNGFGSSIATGDLMTVVVFLEGQSTDGDPIISSFSDDLGHTWNLLGSAVSWITSGHSFTVAFYWTQANQNIGSQAMTMSLAWSNAHFGGECSFSSISSAGALVSNGTLTQIGSGTSLTPGSLTTAANSITMAFVGGTAVNGGGTSPATGTSFWFTNDDTFGAMQLVWATGNPYPPDGNSITAPAGTYHPTFTLANGTYGAAGIIASFAVGAAGSNVTLSNTAPTSNFLNVVGFGLSVPLTSPIIGIEVSISGSQSGLPAGSYLMMSTLNGAGAGTPKKFTLPLTTGSVPLGSDSDLWGTTWTAAEIDSPNFGFLLQAFNSSGTPVTFVLPPTPITVTVFYGPSPRDFNHVTSFEQTDAGVLTLALDDTGVWWEEDVINNPGVLCPFYTALEPNLYAVAVTEDDREFVAFSDLQNGADMPRQYNGTWVDRISQVGPGAPPSISFTTTGYPIASITQPATVLIANGGVQWSAGVNNTASGNVLSVYAGNAQWPDFLENVLIGSVVYLNLTATGLVGFSGTYIVTATGQAYGMESGDGALYNYFQVTATSTGHNNINDAASSGSGVGTYQLTLATVTITPETTGPPLPSVEGGDQITITGATPGAWDSTWTIREVPNGGTFTVASDQIIAAGGGFPAGSTAAVYNIEIQSIPAITPIVGQYVSIFNCTNGTFLPNGENVFDVFQAKIASVTSTGPTSYQITIDPPYVETSTLMPQPVNENNGYGIILGTEFDFEPGLQFVGGLSNPIFGNAGSGGSVIVQGQLGAGERGAVVMFLTRNGYLTQASTPILFALTENASSIAVANLPIGPPNVIARVVAFTGAGGVTGSGGGGYYFWIPTDVVTLSSGQPVTYNKTIIPDNTTTTASFNMADAVLLAAESISVQGSNNFQQFELGNSIGITAFSQRLAAWGVQNKVLNFVNMSFDGGYLSVSSTTLPQPLGWVTDNGGGGLVNSPLFGNAFNFTGATLSQDAYQDNYGVPIIMPQTLYSVRVTAQYVGSPGTLTVSLYSPQFLNTYGTYSLTVTNPEMTIYTGTLLTAPFVTTVPNDLIIQVTANGVLVDRIEPFITTEPVNVTALWFSYFDNFEAFDSITGQLGVGASNQQPIRNVFSLFDNLYIVKTRSIYSTTDNGVTEPSGWSVREVSNKVGTPSIFGVDVGEGWALVAAQAGLYLFDGGEPHKISPEMDGTEADPGPWQLINWKYGNSLWLRNDIENRKITIGVPMIVPNRWCPNFPANANPTTPNVVMVCNYKELMSSEALSSFGPVRLTYTGDLKTYALGRKWALWSIEAGYADFITRPDTTQKEFFCGNTNTSKIYQQIGGNYADDGAAMHCQYITYPFPKTQEAQQMQMGLDMLEATYMTMLLRGSGNLDVTLYPNSPDSPYADAIAPCALSDPMPFGDLEIPLNEVGNRFFVGAAVDVAGEWFELSRIVMNLQQNPWAPCRGSNG